MFTCQVLCQKNDACVFFAYDRYWAACFQKTGSSRPMFFNRFVAGPKFCIQNESKRMGDALKSKQV
jgi:hypothetical protein